MKLPTIQKQSLHLEFLFQIEQKAVLVYHLNNRTFNNVTEGDCKYQVWHLQCFTVNFYL